MSQSGVGVRTAEGISKGDSSALNVEQAAAKAKEQAEQKARLPGEAAAKDKANQEKLAKIDEVKTNIRLAQKGFPLNKKLGGFLFPGVNPKLLR